MTKDELLQPDKRYEDNKKNWQYLDAAAKGVQALIKFGILPAEFDNPPQYEEPGAAWSFNFASLINEKITDFIAGSDWQRDYGKLADDEFFKMFLKDCDLKGTDFHIWFDDVREKASFMGSVGILVDKAAQGESQKQEKDLKIYPYISYYNPLNIPVVKKGFDEVTRRPKYIEIKLHEIDPERVIIWTDEQWAIYDIPEGEDAEPVEGPTGPNLFDEIPYIEFNLEKNSKLVRAIVDIDSNMIKNLIKIDKVLTYTGFPMLERPDEPDNGKPPQELGPGRELSYDPETKARHAWIEPKAEQAINAFLKLINKQTEQIYFMSNLGGVLASGSKDARSSDSQEMSFKFLDGHLTKMVRAEIEVHKNIVRWWLKIQGQEDLFDEVSISHSFEFNTQALIQTISDAMTEKTLLIASPTAGKEIDKRIVRIGTLKDLSIDVQKVIDDEIDTAAVKPEPVDDADLTPKDDGLS